jgi:hypothetical protein
MIIEASHLVTYIISYISSLEEGKFDEFITSNTGVRIGLILLEPKILSKRRHRRYITSYTTES